MKSFLFSLFLLLGLNPLSIGQNLPDDREAPSPEKVKKDSSASKGLFKNLINYFEEAKKDKSAEKFDISFVGGPSYSVTTQFGVGVLASGLYRIDKTDLNLSPSNLSVYSNISTIGFVVIGVRNNAIFKDDAYRINTKMNFAYIPTRYYGIGYHAGTEDDYTEFDEYRLHFTSDFLKRILNENLYAGLTVDAQNIKGKKFKDPQLEPNGRLNNTKVGVGYAVSYDSRDFIPNASKGVLIELKQTFFTKTLGSTTDFNRLEFAFDAYKKIWKDGILAYDLRGEFNNGNTPWNMLSLLGNTSQMRGYYSGRYRDKKQLNTQMEWRQKVYNRHGFVVWGGGGTVFSAFKHLKAKHLLPNYGIGYRWEFKNKINVRLDYGIGKGQSGVVLNVNEAF